MKTRATMYHGNCLDVLPIISSGSIDSIVTDPPYAEIDRDYGRFTEAEWGALMDGVVREARRVLKPKGSAVFILQANNESLGRMRPWLWEFMAKTAREWNQIQDVWWWNYQSPPTAHAQRVVGLLRPSLKALVWLGDPDCYRNQEAIRWAASTEDAIIRSAAILEDKVTRCPSGHRMNSASFERSRRLEDGTSPMNLFPISNSDSRNSAGSVGHGAGSPLSLARILCRYLTPSGGTVLDPFIGSGTMGIAARLEGFNIVGIERDEGYFKIAEDRVSRYYLHDKRVSAINSKAKFKGKK